MTQGKIQRGRQLRRTKAVFNGHFDLGIKKLWPEWKDLFSRRYLKEDTFAGLTVACIAIPLSLAIALASGVSPGVGLVSAIIAGIVCAFFGGTPLGVSGPAAAMSILIATQVEKFGLSGLLIIGLVCGLLQVFSGVFRLGRLAKFVPSPVIAGFTAGIGAIIILGQLPRALGLPAPDQSHIFEVIPHIGNLILQMQPEVFAVTLLSIGIMRGLPKWQPQLPAPLFAVIIPTVLVAAFGLQDVPVVGELPRSLPLPSLPEFPSSGMGDLFTAGLVVFFLASVETLLSSSAVDKLTRTTKHDPDQELIGQGLGNMAVAAFGGIPTTGVIARSAVNVKAGGKTRRASIIHSLTLLVAVFAIAPIIGAIPIAALAGILLSTAFGMLDWQEFKGLWKVSKQEGMVYALTFATILFVDLIAGIQAGIIAMAAICLLRVSQTKTLLTHNIAEAPVRLAISGPLTFLSFAKIEALEKKLAQSSCACGVIIDMSTVTSMDSSGAQLLADFVKTMRKKTPDIVLKGLAQPFYNTLKSVDEDGSLSTLAVAESEIGRHMPQAKDKLVRSRLLHGVEAFKSIHRSDSRGLYEQLAQGQDPHTLFITCVDSRLNPNLMTSTELGELLIARNVGNFVPPYEPNVRSPEGAAIEFAVSHLNVQSIVICGHSSCGAIKACREHVSRDDTPHLNDWLSHLGLREDHACQNASHDEVGKINVLRQIENLLTYPTVWERYKKGEMSIYAWYYDVATRDILEWDQSQEKFSKLRPHKEEPRFTPRIVVGGKTTIPSRLDS